MNAKNFKNEKKHVAGGLNTKRNWKRMKNKFHCPVVRNAIDCKGGSEVYIIPSFAFQKTIGFLVIATNKRYKKYYITKLHSYNSQ